MTYLRLIHCVKWRCDYIFFWNKKSPTAKGWDKKLIDELFKNVLENLHEKYPKRCSGLKWSILKQEQCIQFSKKKLED